MYPAWFSWKKERSYLSDSVQKEIVYRHLWNCKGVEIHGPWQPLFIFLILKNHVPGFLLSALQKQNFHFNPSQAYPACSGRSSTLWPFKSRGYDKLHKLHVQVPPRNTVHLLPIFSLKKKKVQPVVFVAFLVHFQKGKMYVFAEHGCSHYGLCPRQNNSHSAFFVLHVWLKLVDLKDIIFCLLAYIYFLSKANTWLITLWVYWPFMFFIILSL